MSATSISQNAATATGSPTGAGQSAADGGRRGGFRILHKLTVIGILSNIPVFLIGALFVSSQFAAVRIGEAERAGLSHIARIWPNLREALSGPDGGVSYLAAFPDEAGRYDVLLGTVAQQQAIEQAAAEGGLPAVIAGVDLIRRITENSRLIADSDVGTMQAILVVTRQVPQVGAIAYQARVALAEGDDKDRIAALGVFRHMFADASDNLNAADSLNFDSEVSGRLVAAQMAMNEAAADFLTAIDRGVDAAALRVAHDAFQAALIGFAEEATWSLDALLAKRIGAMRRSLWLDIGLGGGLLVLTWGLIWLVTRSITGRLGRLAQAMDAMRAGNLEVEVPVAEAGDEVDSMARAVEVFRTGLVEKRATDEALRRQNETLRRHQLELQAQNARFDAALNNMLHGLALFDRHRRLIVCNKRYAEIYRLPPELVETGTHESRILRHCLETQLLPEGTTLAEAAKALAEATGEAGLRFDVRDGRTIFIRRSLMANGGWVSTHEDITEQQQAEARIAHMAHHDALTMLPNRVLFRQRTEEALAGRQKQDSFAMLCLDLDHFKDVNDALGHPIGDALLQEVARRLEGCVSETCVVARLSGDEFALIDRALETPEHAAALADRIVETIAEPFEIGGHTLIIGASVGIAMAPSDGDDADTLLKSADLALYRAKADGRGTHRFFEVEMDRRLQERRLLEMDLRNAIAISEFRLFYQPLMNVRTGDVACMEALLRWPHPSRGLLAPAEFIDLAEESGLIVPLGEWALRRACEDAAAWRQDIKVAVNLSPVQFRSRNLVAAVTGALQTTGLDPARLELEITESVLLQNTEATLATLHQLRQLGVRVAMDDFGTGYSSLSYLRSFPFDKIKIDRTFTQDISSNGQSMAIVRAVAGLGRSLGIATTAEGVETARQLEILREEGCTEAQGYLFSRPRPPEELRDLLVHDQFAGAA